MDSILWLLLFFTHLIPFGIGYVMRHIDVLRIHTEPDPFEKGIKLARKRMKAQQEEELMKRFGVSPVEPIKEQTNGPDVKKPS